MDNRTLVDLILGIPVTADRVVSVMCYFCAADIRAGGYRVAHVQPYDRVGLEAVIVCDPACERDGR